MKQPATVNVWDPLVRIGHWTLVVGFGTAYLTAGETLELHEWAGYVVAGYVAMRVIWGFVGSKHARFADFLYSPRQVAEYLVGLYRRHARRYLGHSPAGGAMVFALLFMLLGTTVTGMAELAASHGEGPLSGLVLQAPDATQSRVTISQTATSHEKPESTLQELHELFANLTLALIILHIAGVVAASVVHRENLVRSMVSGEKRGLESDGTHTTDRAI
jgi:cytochrome b